jgi:hypothetical protein
VACWLSLLLLLQLLGLLQLQLQLQLQLLLQLLLLLGLQLQLQLQLQLLVVVVIIIIIVDRRLVVVAFLAVTSIVTSIVTSVATLNHYQSRLVKGRSGGLSLAEPVLMVVFLSNIIVERIPVVAGANGGHRLK